MMQETADTARAPTAPLSEPQPGKGNGESPQAEDLHLHVRTLRRYAKALIREPSEADDLVQETLERTLAYLNRGRHIRELRAFLFAVLHNVRKDYLLRRRHTRGHVALDAVSDQLVGYPAPQEVCRECDEVARALPLLPPEQREVVLLVGLEEFSYKAVADILDIPIGTVMSRLHRGREALRRIMAGEA